MALKTVFSSMVIQIKGSSSTKFLKAGFKSVPDKKIKCNLMKFFLKNRHV